MQTQINLPLEMQNIFCSTISNFFSKDCIPIYYTIPSITRAPYIKITSIVITKQLMLNDSITNMCFSLIITTNGPSNQQILNIINNLDHDISDILHERKNENETIKITNASIGDCKISEIIDKKCWSAYCEMNITGCFINN